MDSDESKRKRSPSPPGYNHLRIHPPLPALRTGKCSVPELEALSPSRLQAALLRVFTHFTYANDDNNDLYQHIGGIALPYAVTHNVLKNDPNLLPAAFQEHVARHLSDAVLAAWSQEYKLSASLRHAASVGSSIVKPPEQANLFKAYVGAVEVELGSEPLTSWIGALIATPYIPDGVINPSLEAPPPPPPPPHELASLPRFSVILHERAQQRRAHLQYHASSSGPDHAKEWRMVISVDSVERGVGTGNTKAAAKEDAARVVCHELGWA